MTVTVLKMHCRKILPKGISYRDLNKLTMKYLLFRYNQLFYDPSYKSNVAKRSGYFFQYSLRKRKYIRGNIKWKQIWIKSFCKFVIQNENQSFKIILKIFKFRRYFLKLKDDFIWICFQFIFHKVTRGNDKTFYD